MLPMLQVQQKVISKWFTLQNKIMPHKDYVVVGNSLHSDYVKLKEGSGGKTKRKLSMKLKNKKNECNAKTRETGNNTHKLYKVSKNTSEKVK